MERSTLKNIKNRYLVQVFNLYECLAEDYSYVKLRLKHYDVSVDEEFNNGKPLWDWHSRCHFIRVYATLIQIKGLRMASFIGDICHDS